jgi:hypothetical protein
MTQVFYFMDVALHCCTKCSACGVLCMLLCTCCFPHADLHMQRCICALPLTSGWGEAGLTLPCTWCFAHIVLRMQRFIKATSSHTPAAGVKHISLYFAHGVLHVFFCACRCVSGVGRTPPPGLTQVPLCLTHDALYMLFCRMACRGLSGASHQHLS